MSLLAVVPLLLTTSLPVWDTYAGGPGNSYVLFSREEIRDGKVFQVFLAPACKDQKPACEPWERAWPANWVPRPGDVITSEGFILREKKDA